jgi:tRNA C32,U32 (ribose-2'-O)-methylase TrmJ
LQRALQEFAIFLQERHYPSHAARLEEEMRKVNDILHRSNLELWEVNLFLGMIRHLRNVPRLPSPK